MKPFVPILIPACNAQDYPADTLRMGEAQTCPRKEIILVDDGPSDQTLAVARQFASANVRVVTPMNQGSFASLRPAC
jgi:glycosyltransferase involved in cell wall biosynthesis